MVGHGSGEECEERREGEEVCRSHRDREQLKSTGRSPRGRSVFVFLEKREVVGDRVTAPRRLLSEPDALTLAILSIA